MALISDEQIEQFSTLGYFVTDVVFRDDELAPMRAEFDRVYDEHVQKALAAGDEAGAAALKGQRAYGQFHTFSEVAAAFVRKPIYLEACAKLIGADADLYYNQAAVKPAGHGTKSFGWHQDSGYVKTEPLAYITCWTAIGDSDLANGCIWIIPESHKWGLLEHKHRDADEGDYGGWIAQFEDESAAMPVEMKAGQAAIFSSLLLHRSGPNTSDRTRYGYVPQYHVPDLVREDGQPWGDRVPILRNGQPA